MTVIKWLGFHGRASVCVLYGNKRWPSYSERIWFFGAE